MTAVQRSDIFVPDLSFRNQIEKASGETISACFQCQKCSNGCPLTFAMDIPPHKVIHSIRLGLLDQVLNSDTIWVCASCETCTARCPNNIDIAHIMDTLRQMSVKKGVKKTQKQAPLFHSTFLSNIKLFGRMHEITMLILFAFKNEGIRGILKQTAIGLKMIFKGKIKFFPGRNVARTQINTIFRQAETIKKS